MANQGEFLLERVTQPGDVKAVGATHVLIEAFRHDTVRNMVIGGSEELRRLIHSSAVQATILAGHLYVVVTKAGEVVGTASWFPPGSSFLDSEEQMNQGMNEFSALIATTKPELFSWYTHLVSKYHDLATKAFGSDNDPTGSEFKTANWTLNSFAVLPSYQGKGIGKLLLAAGEKEAASMNKSVCLETNNALQVPMYEHLGYAVVAQDTVDGPPGGASFSHYAFLKTP